MTASHARKVHDADAHLMETPDWLIRHADPEIEERLRPLDLHGMEGEAGQAFAQAIQRRGSAELRAQAEADVLVRKNWAALGAFLGEERSRALDLLGLTSQLVFSTYSHLTLINSPHAPPGSSFEPDVLYGAVTAHNRGVAEFCRADPRLLPVGWVSLDVPDRAMVACREALELGCAAIEVPSYPTGPYSLSHAAFDPLYAMLEEAGRPLMFHVGGGGQVVDQVFENNGRPGRSATHELTFIGISAPIEMAVAALVLGGVFERFPDLMCGVIEQGATWVPGFVRRLDLAVEAFGEPGRPGLVMRPSEYVARNLRFTPFPFEDLAWLIDQCGPRLFMFGSDYPHDEGGIDPVAAFDAALAARSADDTARFYWRNFEDLMGHALTDRLGTTTPDPTGTPLPPLERSDMEAAPLDRSPVADEEAALIRTGEPVAVLRKKVLFRLLARNAAARLGMTVSEHEMQAAVDDFRRQHGLLRLSDTTAWIAREGIDESTFLRVIRDGVLVEKLGGLHQGQVDSELAGQVQMSTARYWQGQAVGGRS
jgi:predicted TIM-barrel fold metal-dependent hydrolase